MINQTFSSFVRKFQNSFSSHFPPGFMTFLFYFSSSDSSFWMWLKGNLKLLIYKLHFMSYLAICFSLVCVFELKFDFEWKVICFLSPFFTLLAGKGLLMHWGWDLSAKGECEHWNADSRYNSHWVEYIQFKLWELPRVDWIRASWNIFLIFFYPRHKQSARISHSQYFIGW